MLLLVMLHQHKREHWHWRGTQRNCITMEAGDDDTASERNCILYAISVTYVLCFIFSCVLKNSQIQANLQKTLKRITHCSKLCGLPLCLRFRFFEHRAFLWVSTELLLWILNWACHTKRLVSVNRALHNEYQLVQNFSTSCSFSIHLCTDSWNSSLKQTGSWSQMNVRQQLRN